MRIWRTIMSSCDVCKYEYTKLNKKQFAVWKGTVQIPVRLFLYLRLYFTQNDDDNALYPYVRHNLPVRETVRVSYQTHVEQTEHILAEIWRARPLCPQSTRCPILIHTRFVLHSHTELVMLIQNCYEQARNNANCRLSLISYVSNET